MTEINKVALKKLNDTLRRIPLTGKFADDQSVITETGGKYRSTQASILGKSPGQTIGGMTAITQSDLYPGDELSVPAIALVTSDAKSEALRTPGKSTKSSDISTLTNSSVQGDGFMHAKVMLGSGQAIKNAYFDTVGEEPDTGYLLQFVPSKFKKFAQEALGGMSPTADYFSQISAVSSGVQSSSNNIKSLTSGVLGREDANIGNTEKAVLSSQNYIEELLKDISKNSLDEDQLLEVENLIISGQNDQAINLVETIGISKGIDIDKTDIEKSLTNLNTSTANSIDRSRANDFKLGKSSRKTKDLGKISNNWKGSNTNTKSYTFEKINSLEELVSELRGCERPITETIVHWTAHFNNQGHVGAKEIHEIGLKRGFKGCSYHYVIKRNGDLERGRPVSLRGAHARTAGHNNFSIGIAFVAGYNCPSSTPNPNRFISAKSITAAQFKTLDMFLKGFFMIFPGGQAFGHMDFDSNKPDPGFDVGEYIISRFNKQNVSNPQDGPVSPTQLASLQRGVA